MFLEIVPVIPFRKGTGGNLIPYFLSYINWLSSPDISDKAAYKHFNLLVEEVYMSGIMMSLLVSLGASRRFVLICLLLGFYIVNLDA